jgi:hypothetical protein
MDSTRLSRGPEPRSRPRGWWRLRACVPAAWLSFAPAIPAQAAGTACAMETRQPYAPYVFLGFACRDRDCSAHKAGFAWADRGGIKEPAGCTGTGDAGFQEGCIAYAEDVVTAEQSGFEWARENEIIDDCHCRGAGTRFEAGCEAYVAGFSR